MLAVPTQNSATPLYPQTPRGQCAWNERAVKVSLRFAALNLYGPFVPGMGSAWGLRASAQNNLGQFSIKGCLMSGFVSVPSSRGAGVVARAGAGGWVWAWRALPGGTGWHPAPAALHVPFSSLSAARSFAQSAAHAGWRVWLRRGSAGSAVFAACGLSVPAWSVKVALPGGMSAAAARSRLAGLQAGGVAA